MDPDCIGSKVCQALRDLRVVDLEETYRARPALDWQKLGFITVQQWDIPCNPLSKAGIDVFADSPVAAIEDFQVDFRRRGQSSEDGRKMLDWMGDDNCQ